MSDSNIPFKIPDVYHGLAESHGVLRLTSNGVHIEYQTKDSVLGLLKSKLHQVQIPFSKISELNFKRKVFTSTLTMRLSHLEAILSIPNQESGTVKFRIPKTHINEAEEFVSLVKIVATNQSLEERKCPLSR